MIEFIPGILFTWAAIWLLYAFTTNLLYPLVRPFLFALRPASASTILLAWITLPAATAMFSCFLLFAPTLSMLMSDAHCAYGGCRIITNSTILVGLPAAIIGFWLGLSGLTIALKYWLPAQKLIRQLKFTGVNKGNYIEIPSDTAAAFTLGWLTPSIYLTRGIIESCTDSDIRCILAHEEAHRRRKDNLSLLVARLFTAVLPSRLVRRQFDDYRLLCEQACDQEAATVQPADEVASVLLKVARLQSRNLPSAATTFVGGHIEERITAVLRVGYPPPSAWYTAMMLGLLLTLTLAPALIFHFWILV